MSHLVSKALTKWTSPSLTHFPMHQCHRIICRYLNSDALFDEINSSFKKLQERQSTKTASGSSTNYLNSDSIPSQPIKKDLNRRSKYSTKAVSAKSVTKSRSSNKAMVHKGSVSLIGNDQKPISALKQRDENYLNRIKSLHSDNALTHQSVFDKYDLIAAELEQQSREYNDDLVHSRHQKRENIDHLIRKDVEQKEREKRQRFQDPIFSELDYYDLSVPDLVTTENITKIKEPKMEKVSLEKQAKMDLIRTELTLPDTVDDSNSNVFLTPFDDVIASDFEKAFAIDEEPKIQRQSQKEMMKSIDWTKLENYLELNGWDDFNAFLEDLDDEKAIQKYSIPSFLPSVPQRRTTLDRPKAMVLGNEERAFALYRINQKVDIEPIKFNRHGDVTVLVNDKHFGFIKKHNLPIDVRIGEFHKGFVYNINYFGKIEVVMEAPNFWTRMSQCQRRIIGVLRYCNGTIEISDKAQPQVIRKLFQMSKKNFKRALGMLLKEGVVEIFNERDADVPSRIVLNQNAVDLKRFDVGKQLEERMWKSKPIWEYGVSAPPFEDILPDEMKERKKKKSDIIGQKFTLRKSASGQ